MDKSEEVLGCVTTFMISNLICNRNARMLGLDPALALVAIFAAMIITLISITLLAALFGGMSIDLVAFAWRLAVLIGGVKGVALLLRHYAITLLIRHHWVVDGMVTAGLLVFALSTMAGNNGPDPR